MRSESSPRPTTQTAPGVVVAAAPGDHPDFLALVYRIMAGILRHTKPQDLFVTRIDHWFDHKWLGFAGKLSGAVGVHKIEPPTLPPFVPNRVVSQESYTRDDMPEMYRKVIKPPLHRHQSSGENLNCFLHHISNSGVLVWFSGNTARADHGSLMVYSVMAEMETGWYAAFRRVSEWHPHKVAGLSRAELTALLAEAPTPPNPTDDHKVPSGGASI